LSFVDGEEKEFGGDMYRWRANLESGLFRAISSLPSCRICNSTSSEFVGSSVFMPFSLQMEIAGLGGIWRNWKGWAVAFGQQQSGPATLID